ncbi:MAG: hypothetical protein ACOVP5_08055 [Chitinophagales bacterium]
MKKTVFLIGFLFATILSSSQSGSLSNNPNFTMIWNEEFDPTLPLNTTRWTIKDITPDPLKPIESYPRNHQNNVRITNTGWLRTQSFKVNGYFREGAIFASIPNIDNVYYEVRSRFRNGYSAGANAWIWGGNADCPTFNFARYQEIDFLEYVGINQKTTGQIHYCKCTCTNPTCQTARACNEDGGNGYSLTNVEQDQIYYAHWTTRNGIRMGQNYVAYSTILNNPAQMINNQDGKFIEIGSGDIKCRWNQGLCDNQPYWHEVDYVRFFQPILECWNDIIDIPNFATYTAGVKGTITLGGATVVPANSNNYLYASGHIDLNPSFTVTNTANLEFGVIICR